MFLNLIKSVMSHISFQAIGIFDMVMKRSIRLNITNVKKVQRETSISEVNKLLKQDWTLLLAYVNREDGHVFVLGRAY